MMFRQSEVAFPKRKTANGLTIMLIWGLDIICQYFPVLFPFYYSLTSLLKIPMIFERWASPLLSAKYCECVCATVYSFQVCCLSLSPLVKHLHICVYASVSCQICLYTVHSAWPLMPQSLSHSRGYTFLNKGRHNKRTFGQIWKFIKIVNFTSPWLIPSA